MSNIITNSIDILFVRIHNGEKNSASNVVHQYSFGV